MECGDNIEKTLYYMYQNIQSTITHLNAIMTKKKRKKNPGKNSEHAQKKLACKVQNIEGQY